ncbi:MAG: hypothetical protein JXQ27_00015 [Acidobacteria bacterium]|nr:hypothetical protein [Acidobacteriota bacterium]
MKRNYGFLLAVLLVLGCSGGLTAADDNPLHLEVRVDGRPLPVHIHHGRCYIEAAKGCEYTIVLHNRSPRRIAVALSVDGLNTIDAKHVSARQSSKWVLDPWRRVEISGWQVSRDNARRFYFTTEDDSYGAALGRMENLGLISAAVFREVAGHDTAEIEAPAADRSARRQNEADAKSSACREAVKDFAATGMGRQVDHRVRRMQLELEERPCQTINLRYEYRPELVRLGVLPRPDDGLVRREAAQGFGPDSFCPEIRR